MKSFLGRIFGKSNEKNTADTGQFIGEFIETLVDKTKMSISFDIFEDEEFDNSYKIEFYGEDEGLILTKNAMLLESIQLYVKRALQHNFKDKKIRVHFDCDNYRNRMDKKLELLAEQLRETVRTKKKSVFTKILPPRKRKIIHQFFTNDKEVCSVSVGDGLFKKVKIYLKGDEQPNV